MNTIFNILALIFISIYTTSHTPAPVVQPSHPAHKAIVLAAEKSQPKPSAAIHPATHLSMLISQQVQHLSKKAPELNKKVLTLALTAYKKAAAKGSVKKPVLTVIDYSLPSSKQRMWIFDLSKERLLYNTYVAHGMNSGMNTPHHFSNRPSSKETSLGTYVTRGTYFGHKGLSLNLQGMERGFNDNAYSRRVVIHGAWYVEPDFIKKTGRAGRSWGCPSIAETLAKPVINTIKGGSVVFAYYPDKNYLSHSGYLVG